MPENLLSAAVEAVGLPVLVCVPVLAAVQCVFGVGLLLFGTPLLLMFGVPYVDVLNSMLPASITLSLLQIAKEHKIRQADVARLAVWVYPSVMLGSALTLLVFKRVDLRLVVALLLLLTATMRSSVAVQKAMQRGFEWLGRAAWPGIALLHGISNMGGGLLTVYAGSRHRNKADIHREITTAYALFASGQLAVLYAVGELPDVSAGLLYPPLATAAIFFIFGSRVYRQVSDRIYQPMFSVFMLCCAGLLFYQANR